MTARRWPTQGSVRAWLAGAETGRTPRCLFLSLFSSVRFVPVTDLIFGGFRNVLLGVGFSAWPGARAMAADVPYPGFVRYVHSHLRMMTIRIIPVSPQQLRGKHHQREQRVMTMLEWTPILMCHLEVALFACLSTSYKLIPSNRPSHR
jgi:hypothetical protein